MKTNIRYNKKNGFKNFHKTKILIVGLLLVFQMAGAKKNETVAVLKTDSALFNTTGNEMTFLHKLSLSEIKDFSEATKNYFEVGVEVPLKLADWQIKAWMPDEKYVESICVREEEAELQLEEWMTDDQYWRIDR
jgi:hypothetical protein